MVSPAGTSSAPRAMVIASAVTVAGALPVFSTAAMSVQLTRDLDFGTVGIGAAVAAYFGTMALTSLYFGRATDRLGATLALRIAGIASAVSCLGIAVTATNWFLLAAWLVLAGSAGALAQPAANRLLVNRVRVERLGTAFGLKQSAPPTASMLAGLSVPAIALTVGWRWAFALISLYSITAVIAVGRRPSTAPARVSHRNRAKLEPLADPATLAVLAVGMGLGFSANSAVLAYYVDAAVRFGTSAQLAGFVFAAASLSAILVRVSAGVSLDRLGIRPLRLCAILLGAGAIGTLLLSLGGTAFMTVGAFVAIAGTWGYPGVFWYAVVRAYPAAPGRITGVMAPSAAGGAIGPLGFGALATSLGYPTAWRITGVIALLAATAMIVGGKQLARNAERDLA